MRNNLIKDKHAHTGISLMSIFQLLRPLQWLKNLFIFLPLFFSHHLFEKNSQHLRHPLLLDYHQLLCRYTCRNGSTIPVFCTFGILPVTSQETALYLVGRCPVRLCPYHQSHRIGFSCTFNCLLCLQEGLIQELYYTINTVSCHIDFIRMLC